MISYMPSCFVHGWKVGAPFRHWLQYRYSIISSSIVKNWHFYKIRIVKNGLFRVTCQLLSFFLRFPLTRHNIHDLLSKGGYTRELLALHLLVDTQYGTVPYKLSSIQYNSLQLTTKQAIQLLRSNEFIITRVSNRTLNGSIDSFLLPDPPLCIHSNILYHKTTRYNIICSWIQWNHSSSHRSFIDRTAASKW